MKIFAILSAILVTGGSWMAAAQALTVDEIIKLKQAGVADSTIELLIKRSGDARSAGVWKQDGWIVHSTESRFPDVPRIEDYQSEYPMTVYPEVYDDRHRRSR
jgi:hypothetical protein